MLQEDFVRLGQTAKTLGVSVDSAPGAHEGRPYKQTCAGAALVAAPCGPHRSG